MTDFRRRMDNLNNGNAGERDGLGVLGIGVALVVEHEHSDLVAKRLTFEDATAGQSSRRPRTGALYFRERRRYPLKKVD